MSVIHTMYHLLWSVGKPTPYSPSYWPAEIPIQRRFFSPHKSTLSPANRRFAKPQVFRPIRASVKSICLVAAILLFSFSIAVTDTIAATTEAVHSPVSTYPVTRFVLTLGDAPSAPPVDLPVSLEDVRSLTIPLILDKGIYTVPTGSHAPDHAVSVEVALGDQFPTGTQFSDTALVAIFQKIAAHYNQHGIYGVFVVVDRDDIDPQTHEDFRSSDNHDLRLVIWTSRIGLLRSIAKGTRFPETHSLDNPAHRFIRQHSPLQPSANDTSPSGSGDLLRKADIDNYLLRLNRHPARRVDAAVSAGTTPGDIVLDYLVSEKRTWFAYAQVSNTGTESTNSTREHAGIAFYQLTNRDDTLQFDFSTASFDGSNAGSLSYEIPLIYPDYLRARVYGSYGEFTAEDVAIGLEEFKGDSTTIGGELAWSPLRFGLFSFDIVPGLSWQRYTVDNRTISQEGEVNLIVPALSFRLQRYTEAQNTGLSLGFEANLSGLAPSSSSSEINTLGRPDATLSYQLLTLDARHSFYLEPLFFGEGYFIGDHWQRSTRAHEIHLSMRGQRVLGGGDDRLIPQKQMTLGGMYSIRGYPESLVAGDNVIMATAEYRLHLPRLFRPANLTADNNLRGDIPPPPALFGRPFNWRAPSLHTLPDWDLIARIFVDAGHAHVNDAAAWEKSQSLLGIGIGLEAQMFGNLSARFDWGFAQKSVRTTNDYIDKGSSQFHFSVSLLW